MNPEAINLTLNLPTLAAIAAAAWFFWMRYQSLEVRLRKIETDLLEERHALDVSRQATISDREQMEYLTNANHELIEHRTRRFQDCVDRLERRVYQEIAEIKQFLDKTTDFKPRNRIDL